ncbi:MAG: hypothetical protein ACJ8FI_01565 [Sphingomicrobium sp.]
MTKVRNKNLHQEKTFTLDGKFLRDEAREAVRSYLSPFAGIYAAATGQKIILVRDKDGDCNERTDSGLPEAEAS